jgi:hypothetical protein
MQRYLHSKEGAAFDSEAASILTAVLDEVWQAQRRAPACARARTGKRGGLRGTLAFPVRCPNPRQCPKFRCMKRSSPEPLRAESLGQDHSAGRI